VLYLEPDARRYIVSVRSILILSTHVPVLIRSAIGLLSSGFSTTF